jgi:RecA/RadA recombinase
MIGTMAELFEAAGYKEFRKMTPYESVEPKRKISIASWENGCFVKKRITHLIYKGEAAVGIKVMSEAGIWIGTNEHLIYDALKNKFVRLEDAKKDKFFGLTKTGQIIEVFFEDIKESFSVLDISVDGTQCYFSGGLLSHNSFGGSARAMSEGLRKLNIILSNYDTSLLVISQERASMSAMAHLPSTTGGFALPFYSSFRARVTKIDTIKNKDDTIGQKIRVRNYKSKIGVPFRDAQMNLYFQGGFNPEEEYVGFLIDLGIVQASGAWINAPEYGIHVNGRAKLQEWLNEHPEEYEKLKQRVNDALKGETVLDTNNVDPESTEGQELEQLGITRTEVELEDSVNPDVESPDMTDLEDDEPV